jgi:hypothetical protein
MSYNLLQGKYTATYYIQHTPSYRYVSSDYSVIRSIDAWISGSPSSPTTRPADFTTNHNFTLLHTFTDEEFDSLPVGVASIEPYLLRHYPEIFL